MSNANDRAGWGLKQWTSDLGKTRAWYYGLPTELQPTSVKVGHTRFITESPREYLQRIGKQAAA